MTLTSLNNRTSSVTTPEFKSTEKMPTVAVGARRGGADPQDATFVLIFGVFRPFSRSLQDLGLQPDFRALNKNLGPETGGKDGFGTWECCTAASGLKPLAAALPAR